MQLPIEPPVAPMLAKATKVVPRAAEGESPWWYEPKWDGFRAIVFRDGDEVVIGSRGGKDLARYFPEMVEQVREYLSERCVIDGELVVAREVDGILRLSWDALSERIHPAASRVAMLAERQPASLIAFDVLALGDEDLTGLPFSERRERLRPAVRPGGGCHVTAATDDPDVAERWFREFEGAGLDGVVAKRADSIYLPNKREMIKVKHARTADCVLFGYRVHKSGRGVGSLLLGLYHDDQLYMIGGSGSFSDAARVELLDIVEPLRVGADVVAEGEATRWRAGADRSWIPLRPERVLEVAYDQMEGDAAADARLRLRHTAKFLRWRPDREPSECTFEQLDIPARYDVSDVLAGR
ncbi:ATP-dependent DNA ligase [Millisia brevis]|uniref:ATP-dependent DNA ligase n=1 Tax=Millisia brevis TaxID=264148 RepID=UPI0008333263|nr:ATP-dependent DNA ligase [Millisia brevis]